MAGVRNPSFRWIFHVGFWLFVLLLYALFFAQDGQEPGQIFLFVGMLLVVTMAATYFINYHLIPAFLLRNRQLMFVLYFLYTLLAALFLESIITLATYILITDLNIRDISPAALDVRYALAALLLIIFLGVAIKLLSHWQHARRQYDVLLKEKTEAELRFLKSQLSPHFLFNTLNNLYSLSVEKSDLAPKAILALSELLRYVLTETRALYVPLSLELDLVRHFIELEQLRFSDRISICLDTNESTGTELEVAPMLLLTLVENAFKHGVGKSNGQHFIHIAVKSQTNLIEFRVENSIREHNGSESEGIGLLNLRTQLNLLYPDRHQFSATRQRDRFVAVLNLVP